MKYNQKTIQKIEKDCNLCKANFMVWLMTLNFDEEKEENIKEHLYNYCPSCRVLEGIKK